MTHCLVMTSYFIDHLLRPDQQSNGNVCGISACTTWQWGRGSQEFIHSSISCEPALG